MNRVKIPDIYEFAAYLATGTDEYDDVAKVEAALEEKYSITIEDFERLIQQLVPMIFIGNEILTGQQAKGFGIPREVGVLMVAKMSIAPPQNDAAEGKTAQ